MEIDRIMESVFKRLLQESQPEEDLAAFTPENGGRLSAVIYSTSELSKRLRAGESIEVSSSVAVRGYVEVKLSDYPCNDSWEVKTSWGPGIGRIVYGLAFALTPKGRLMPDRDMVSDSAGESWRKASKKGLIAEPLDDIDHEVCRAMGTHTPDERDDCPVHSDGRPWIDRSYDAGPLMKEYKRTMKELTARHDGIVDLLGEEVVRKIGSPRYAMKYLEDWLEDSAKKAAWNAI